MRAYRFLEQAAASTCAEFAERATIRMHSAGDVLFNRGDRADELFAIDRGRVKVWRTAENGTALTLAYMGQGSLAGIMATMLDQRHTVSTTAATPVSTTSWPAAFFRDLAARDPGLAGGIAALLAGRAEMLVDRIEEVSSSSVDQRVARTLVRLGAEVVRDAANGAIELPLSRGDIAELTHSTVPTVSRLMGKWQAAGIVASRRGYVTILEPETLAAIGGIDG